MVKVNYKYEKRQKELDKKKKKEEKIKRRQEKKEIQPTDASVQGSETEE